MAAAPRRSVDEMVTGRLRVDRDLGESSATPSSPWIGAAPYRNQTAHGPCNRSSPRTAGNLTDPSDELVPRIFEVASSALAPP